MNKIILKGRFTKEMEMRFTAEGVGILNNSIAVKRNRKNTSGEYDTDFFNVVVYGKMAEHIKKYFKKGQEALISGRLQNQSWEGNDGIKRHDNKIVIEEIHFCGSKTDTVLKDNENDFITINDNEELPF